MALQKHICQDCREGSRALGHRQGSGAWVAGITEGAQAKLKEFREFAMRGHLVDMAVGIIMGVAFGGLVNSMVNDIIMPIVGKITGGVDFSNMFLNLSGPQDQFASLKAAKDAGAATINYGLFVNLFFNFLLGAFVIFLPIKCINKMKKVAPPSAPPVPPPAGVSPAGAPRH